MIDRRVWMQTVGASLGLLAYAETSTSSSEVGRSSSSSLRKPQMRLGLVTYNLAKDWDIETIIKNCEETKFNGVELRTTHTHGVEVSLTPTQRAEVKKRFEDSAVDLMGLGSAFDYHTPDPDELRKIIEATKEYIVLAHDVGARGVKVRPNAFPKGVSKEKTLEQIGLSLREVGEFAKDYDIDIRLEVHGSENSLLPNIQKMIEIADHPRVGVCWNSNDSDLEGDGFEANFNRVRDKIFNVHITEIYNENYPYRKLFRRLNEIGYKGYCLAEIPGSSDPIRLMKYYRGLWLALQNCL